MAGSRRVQSARSKATFCVAISASKAGLDRVVFLLYWQVTHQAAVKSTNTGRPWARSTSRRSGLQGCQRMSDEELEVLEVSLLTLLRAGSSIGFSTQGPSVLSRVSSKAIANSAIVRRARPASVRLQISRLTLSNSASKAAAPSTPLC